MPEPTQTQIDAPALPSAPAENDNAGKNPAKRAASEGGYKETIESILIAFILAFIFRSFVVEAFVIPTGSMAPTLYGAHQRFRCPDCGYVFDANVQGRNVEGVDDVDIPSAAHPVVDFHCPNCGYTDPATDPEYPRPLPVRFGDRILVLKYIYLLQKPVRWDVVVFKSPDVRDTPPGTRYDLDYAQNYIKRLIGIGPESVVILDGDIYTGPIEADRPVGPDGKPWFTIQRKPDYVQNALWRVIYHNDFTPHLSSTQRGSQPAWQQPWQILASPVAGPARAAAPTGGTKGSAVATESAGASPAAAGWTIAGPASADWPGGSPQRVFDFNNPIGGSTLFFNDRANPDAHYLTDYLVYDEANHRKMSDWQPVYVGDLKLSLDYTRKSGDGPLKLYLSHGADVFIAEIDAGAAQLSHATRSAKDPSVIQDVRKIGETGRMPELAGTNPLRIDFSNVDYRVSLRINGKEVIATSDADYAPDVAALWAQEQEGSVSDLLSADSSALVTIPDDGLIHICERDRSDSAAAHPFSPVIDTRYVKRGDRIRTFVDEYARPSIEINGNVAPLTASSRRRDDVFSMRFQPRPIVRIEAQKQQSTVEHLVLARDIYYLSHRTGATFWGTVDKLSHLAAGEYFTMGDNSFISGDARYWNVDIRLPHERLMVDSGRVPDRFMLGKAFFVYWPAGYSVPFTSLNAVPDFGEMRMIH